ncbi:hypothetical protein BHE74_00009056 [Ensete ventricosum]|nr:hypothetical protein BHE74_00009056 [Ensete ventricosum]RZR81672.1 hypothetical protein BHM03_00007954 [Ensete ventricosum]
MPVGSSTSSLSSGFLLHSWPHAATASPTPNADVIASFTAIMQPCCRPLLQPLSPILNRNNSHYFLTLLPSLLTSSPPAPTVSLLPCRFHTFVLDRDRISSGKKIIGSVWLSLATMASAPADLSVVVWHLHSAMPVHLLSQALCLHRSNLLGFCNLVGEVLVSPLYILL